MIIAGASADPLAAIAATSPTGASVGFAALDSALSALIARGVADSTRRVYAAGQRRFVNFCSRFSLTPFPAVERTLCLFCAQMASDGLRYSSIKTYLAGVRFVQISDGGSDPLAGWQRKFARAKKAKESDATSRPERRDVPEVNKRAPCLP